MVDRGCIDVVSRNYYIKPLEANLNQSSPQKRTVTRMACTYTRVITARTSQELSFASFGIECYQPTELIWAFLFQNFSDFTPPPHKNRNSRSEPQPLGVSEVLSIGLGWGVYYSARIQGEVQGRYEWWEVETEISCVRKQRVRNARIFFYPKKTHSIPLKPLGGLERVEGVAWLTLSSSTRLDLQSIREGVTNAFT